MAFSLNDLIRYYERNNFDKDSEIRVVNNLAQGYDPKYCYGASAEIWDFSIVPSTGGKCDQHDGPGRNFFSIIIADDVCADQAQDDINLQIDNNNNDIENIRALKQKAEKQIEEYEEEIKLLETLSKNQIKNW